jgi:predicted transcriptional regulator
MARLGELERAVMEVLWAAGQQGRSPVTARDVIEALPDRELATTTVLTVLSRLEAKHLVVRIRDGRAHHYQAVGTREDHIAGLMREVLGTAPDRTAALARFVDTVSAEEAAALRLALRELEDP